MKEAIYFDPVDEYMFTISSDGKGYVEYTDDDGTTLTWDVAVDWPAVYRCEFIGYV